MGNDPAQPAHTGARSRGGGRVARSRLTTLLALALALGACGPEGDDDAWIEVGTGTDGFVALSSGQEVDIIFGPQGGYHVWGALRADGVDGDNAAIRFELSNEAGEVVADAFYLDDLPEVDGVLEYDRVTVILFNDVPPESLDGLTMTLRTEVVTSSGRALRDSVEIVPRCCVDQVIDDPWIEVGLGELEYVRVQSGDPVSIVEVDGEYGFWAALRGGDFAPEGGQIDVILGDSREVMFAQGQLVGDLPVVDDEIRVTGIWVPLLDDVAVDELDGRETTLGMRIISSDGVEEDEYEDVVIQVR